MMEELYERLKYEGSQLEAEFVFDVEMVPGPMPVLQVTVKDRDSLPLFVSVSGQQLLSIAHLFRDQDVIAERRDRMIEKMLELSIPMPLSSYGKMGDLYVVFGAMAVDSSIEEILLELEHLSENALEAHNAMREFLIDSAAAA